MPKYSVLIPVRRGSNYIRSIIETIIEQEFDDYELIISDNFSTDGTAEILEQFKDPHIKVIRPHHVCNMSEHFEFIVRHAKGAWVIILGVDDGLFPYSFELAERLTRIAISQGVRAIMSRRAYYFWPGCEAVYGDTAVNYYAENKIEIRNTKVDFLCSLIGSKTYFELPQMYSNSLFERSLLSEVIERQGKIFTSIIPDANLAVIACSLEKKYVFSDIPLGWIGSSPASNGLSFSLNSNCEKETLLDSEGNPSEDYSRLNKQSKMMFDPRAGDIKYADLRLILWESILNTRKLRGILFNKLLLSKVFLGLILSKGMIDASVGLNSNKMNNYLIVAKHNKIKTIYVNFVIKILKLFKYGINSYIGTSIYRFFNTFKQKIYQLPIKKSSYQRFEYKHLRIVDSNITMTEANDKIYSMYLKNFKVHLD